jgi:hypothetical protein
MLAGCTGLTPTSDCPFNFFRTSGDPEPGWGTIMRELNTLRQVEIPAYGNNSKWHPHPPYNPTNSTPRSRVRTSTRALPCMIVQTRLSV